MNRGPRGPKDDFFCWKFGVWYNLHDCLFRHAYETHPECAQCRQGEANLKIRGHVPPLPRWVKLFRAGQEHDVRKAQDR